jgi:hypothetical protein
MLAVRHIRIHQGHAGSPLADAGMSASQAGQEQLFTKWMDLRLGGRTRRTTACIGSQFALTLPLAGVRKDEEGYREKTHCDSSPGCLSHRPLS